MCFWCTGKYYNNLYFYHLQFSRCRMGTSWRIQVWSWIMTPHSWVEFAVGVSWEGTQSWLSIKSPKCSCGVVLQCWRGWGWSHNLLMSEIASPPPAKPQSALLSSLGLSHFRYPRSQPCVVVIHLRIPLSVMFLSPMSQCQWISPGFNGFHVAVSWWKLLMIYTILLLLQFWLVIGSLCQIFVAFMVCKKLPLSGLTNQRWGKELFSTFIFF